MGKPEVLPLTGRIGAEIRGVRLDPELDSATASAIYNAWLEHKVIFFRKQEHLDDEAHEGLAWIFGGAAMAHPTVPVATGTEFIYELDSRIGAASYWHTDLTWSDALPRGSILRALIVPPYSGDTLWANTARAYADLPPRLRALADNSWAIHSNGSDYMMARVNGPSERNGDERAFWSAFQSAVLETRHPLVHVHPETLESCLLLGTFVGWLLGMTAARSAGLDGVFQRYITHPENTVRWRWAVGDVPVWETEPHSTTQSRTTATPSASCGASASMASPPLASTAAPWDDQRVMITSMSMVTEDRPWN
jgi:alpha-ketoglutarate-dependent sulfate ester dioxygenase